MNGKSKSRQIRMVWLLLFVVCGCVSCHRAGEKGSENRYVKIDESTFPEESLRKKAEAADEDGDGRLSGKEAGKVKKLNLKKFADSKDDAEGVPWPEYTPEDFTFDFEGIQYFTELTELHVNLLGGEIFVLGQPEEILVVTDNFHRIYECTKIVKLSLCEADITTLDLSAFPDLKRLDLSFMYNMESLKIGDHKKLSALWISDCHRLEELDVSKLLEIKNLDVVRNENLKEIQFGVCNGRLESLQLNELKSLYEIDLSDLSNLKALHLMQVPFTSIDVGMNPATLTGIDIQGTAIKELDVRGYPKLEYLYYDEDVTKILR